MNKAILTLALLLSACGGGGSASDSGTAAMSGSSAAAMAPVMADTSAAFTDSDGTSYSARHPVGASSFLVDAAGPLDGLLVLGQSNAGGTGSDAAPRLNGALFPHTVVTAGSGAYSIGGGAPAMGGDFAEFQDLSDAAAPATDYYTMSQFPATVMGFAAERLSRDAGKAPAGLYVHTAFDPGQPVEAFLRSSPRGNFSNAVYDVTLATAVAQKYRRTLNVRAILWIQGETTSPGYGPTLAALIDDLVDEVRKTTGQTERPVFLIQQINIFDDVADYTGVELAQLALARTKPGVVLVGPSYQAPFGNDTIHTGNLGRMMLGETAALVFNRVRNGAGFTPLWPTTVTRSGPTTIDIAFNLPGGALRFDTDWVPPTPNQGFVYIDDANSAAISKVELVSATTVRITLDRVPIGFNPRIRYALGNETTVDKFAGGRGNLFSEDAAASVYARLGYKVPAKIRHYAVRFEERVPN